MMRLPHPRLAPKSWFRRPRRSARLRLTILYGGLFLISGAVLLAITYVLFNRAAASYIDGAGGRARIVQPGDTAKQLHQLQTQLAARDAAGQASTRAVFAHQLLTSSGIALGVVAVIAVILGWFVAGRVLGPLRTITATARRISATNLSERLALDGADEEFKQLGDTLDDLFARLDDAFEAQRHFVANASHELRTPLTRERALVQVALGDPSTSDVWRSTGQELLASNREQGTLIEALLTLASGESGLDHRERTDLADICQSVLPCPGLDTDRLELHIETAIRSAPLDGDPRLIECLLANLVDNAVGHNVVGGHVQISTDAMDGRAVLTVTNTGPVVPPTEIDRLFQPFQRLDHHRTHHKNGHGLGLSIVRAIATAHDATITAHPEPEGGLSVTVTFPAPETPQGPSGRSPRSARSRGERGANRSSVGDSVSATQA
jgi:signal transduction histidine kinase